MQRSRSPTYLLIKIHEVGNNFYIRVEDTDLSNYLFQYVTNTRWKYEHWDVAFIQFIKKQFITIPAKAQCISGYRSQTIFFQK